MGKLIAILGNGDGDDIRNAWDSTDAADDYGPLPPGEYIAHIIGGDLETSRTKATPSYKLTFKVIEGEHSERQFWHDVWLTAAALPMAKRDLGKLGVQSLEQLEQPLARFIRIKAKLALHRDDDGNEYNRLKRFEVIGIDKPEADEFAPDDATEGDELNGDDDDDSKLSF